MGKSSQARRTKQQQYDEEETEHTAEILQLTQGEGGSGSLRRMVDQGDDNSDIDAVQKKIEKDQKESTKKKKKTKTTKNKKASSSKKEKKSKSNGANINTTSKQRPSSLPPGVQVGAIAVGGRRRQDDESDNESSASSFSEDGAKDDQDLEQGAIITAETHQLPNASLTALNNNHSTERSSEQDETSHSENDNHKNKRQKRKKKKDKSQFTFYAAVAALALVVLVMVVVIVVMVVVQRGGGGDSNDNGDNGNTIGNNTVIEDDPADDGWESWMNADFEEDPGGFKPNGNTVVRSSEAGFVIDGAYSIRIKGKGTDDPFDRTASSLYSEERGLPILPGGLIARVDFKFKSVQFAAGEGFVIETSPTTDYESGQTETHTTFTINDNDLGWTEELQGRQHTYTASAIFEMTPDTMSAGQASFRFRSSAMADENRLYMDNIKIWFKAKGDEHPGPGNDGPGNDGPGNDGPGNDGPGNDGPGNDGPGNDGPADNVFGNSGPPS